jgi:hypothetical protein
LPFVCRSHDLDTRRDPDGRFRVNEFFCYAPTLPAVYSWARLLAMS